VKIGWRETVAFIVAIIHFCITYINREH